MSDEPINEATLEAMARVTCVCGHGYTYHESEDTGDSFAFVGSCHFLLSYGQCECGKFLSVWQKRQNTLARRAARDKLRAIAKGLEEDLLLADGFEAAALGVATRSEPDGEHRFFMVYDREHCIEILMQRDGMDRGGAEEFFDYNVIGTYAGPSTPAHLIRRVGS